MKKKILILGATGMAGHVVYYYLNESGKYDLFNTVYRNPLTSDSILCDVRNEEHLINVIERVKPEIIINCVGALITESKANPANAIKLNSVTPHFLRQSCDKREIKLIHISTDCVFSGKHGQYAENDFRDADDVYGRGKALGEIFDPDHITLRTSIIGPELKKNGEGLFHWFMQQEGTIKGFTQAFWGGVTSLELAKAIEKAIDNSLYGLMHLTNGNRISKNDLLLLFKKHFPCKAQNIEPYDNKFVDKSLMLSERYDFKVPDYEDMIKEMKNFMEKRPQIYGQYLMLANK